MVRDKSKDEKLVRLMDQLELCLMGHERWFRRARAAMNRCHKLVCQGRRLEKKIEARRAEIRSEAARRANETRRADRNQEDTTNGQ